MARDEVRIGKYSSLVSITTGVGRYNLYTLLILKVLAHTVRAAFKISSKKFNFKISNAAL